MNPEFWPWWLSALCVGCVATAYPLVSGRLLGVSSLYAAVFTARRRTPLPSAELELALLAETESHFGPASAAPPESRADATLRRWRADAEGYRPLFLIGMLAGAGLTGLAGGSWDASMSLGARFDARYGALGLAPLVTLLASGVAIGVGTRLGAGCTSGHGISGVARGQPGSLLTTAVFWSTAFAVTWLVVGLG